MYERAQDRPVVEPQLLDFKENIYGKWMNLDFCLRLRAEKKFEGISELQEQIARDVAATRKYLQRIKERGLGGDSAHKHRRS